MYFEYVGVCGLILDFLEEKKLVSAFNVGWMRRIERNRLSESSLFHPNV